MADEGFHEIQLNGKQLVFLFMAATVVSVVVFLLGVMVGRNVRQPAAQLAAVSAPETPIDPTADPRSDPATTAQGGATASTSDRTPLSAQESLTYTERLEAPEPADETFREAAAAASVAAKPAPVPEPTVESTRRESPSPTKTAPVAPVAANVAGAEPGVTTVQRANFNEPTGAGWVVQVMAAVKREEAESLAQRLSVKGYPTFVSVGDGKVPAKYRVRVGKYTEKREAEAIELKLQKQEQFKTWLTR